MTAITAAEQPLFDELTCRHIETDQLVDQLREAALTIDILDPQAVIEHTRQLTLARQQHDSMEDVLAMQLHGQKHTELYRGWVEERGFKEQYHHTNANGGSYERLPLKLCVEYQIDMLRTHYLNRMGMEGERDMDQLRRGNVLGALQTALNRQAMRQVADELEQLLAAS